MMLVVVLQTFLIAALLWSGRRRTEDALSVFCFFLTLMPLEARLVLPGLFDLNTMRVSLLSLLVLFLVHKKPQNAERLPLKNLMLLHVAWALCSTAYSLSVATSIKQLISQVLEYYLMYFLVVRSITSTKTIYKILYSMMMAITICCVFALFEAYASYSILRVFPSNLWITYNGGVDPLYIEWGRGLRVRSTFPHPILFGDALAMSIPIALYLLSIWKDKMQRILLWAGLLLMAWAIYKTSSRGPWMAAGACCGLLALMVKNRVRRYLVAVAALLFVILLARPGIWETMSSLYAESTDTTNPVGTSYLFRHALNQAVEQAVQKDPLRFALGYGLGTFRELGLEIDFLGSVKRWYTCDDNWAAFLYETGYGGLIIMCLLLGKTLLIAWRGYRRTPRPENRLSGVLFISLAGFYFLLLSVAGYNWGQQGYMAWMLISLAVSHSRVVRGTQIPGKYAEDKLDTPAYALA
jgi:O-Antigen ligase